MSSTIITTSSVNTILTHLTICSSQMNDRRRKRLRQDQMEHADDVDLSVEAMDVGGVLVYYQSHRSHHI